MSHILPEFQKYLVERKLAPEKQIPFYAYWASRFLRLCSDEDIKPYDLKIQIFLDVLKKDPKISDWQLTQAANAVKLYIHHYLSGDHLGMPAKSIEPSNNSFPDLNSVQLKLREALRIKHYALSTEKTYTDWFRRFYDYLKHTRKKNWATEGANQEDVRNFLSYLAIHQRVSASTQNQAFNALLFLFRHVLQIRLGDLDKTVRAKRGAKLPAVLTPDEMRQLLGQVSGRDLLLVHMIYGTGMRLMEAARLRVKDVDFGSNTIIVRAGKGDKDRATILPETIKAPLTEHLTTCKKIHEQDLAKGAGDVYMPDALDRKYPNAGKEWRWQYVFPANALSVDPRSGKVRRHHISPNTISNIVSEAVKKAGIPKHVTVHTLRHSFATHLLMNGVNIREVQELLGHKNVETTMIYTHVLRDMSHAPKSPLDDLLAGSKDR